VESPRAHLMLKSLVNTSFSHCAIEVLKNRIIQAHGHICKAWKLIYKKRTEGFGGDLVENWACNIKVWPSSATREHSHFPRNLNAPLGDTLLAGKRPMLCTANTRPLSILEFLTLILYIYFMESFSDIAPYFWLQLWWCNCLSLEQ